MFSTVCSFQTLRFHKRIENGMQLEGEMIVRSSYRSTWFQITFLLYSCRLLPSHLIYKPPEFTYSRFIFLISNFLLTQDFVPPEVIELLQSSRNTLIQELFQTRSHTQDKDARQEVSWSERFTRLYHFIATLVSLFSEFFCTAFVPGRGVEIQEQQ